MANKMSAQGGSASGGKKIFLGTLVLAFALTLSACGKKAPEAIPGAENTPVQTKDNQPTNNGIVSSIKDAMGLGKKMECTYTENVDGKETKSVTQVDGKNFKSISEVNGKKMYSMMKDEIMYTWIEGTAMANKIALSCLKDLQKNLPQGQVASAPQDPEKAFDSATNVSCKPLDSIDISVPSDINFVDQCEQMKNLSKQLKDIKIPAGVQVPNIPGGAVPQAE